MVKRSGKSGVPFHCYYSKVLTDSELVSVSVPFMGQIDLLEIYSYMTGLCVLKKLKKWLHKNINLQWTQFPNI